MPSSCWSRLNLLGIFLGHPVYLSRMDGSSFDYDNWGPTQPDNLSGSEFCLHMNTHQGNWNDIDCVEKDPNVVASYICQVNQD